jgi:hypothetical protein
VLLENKNAVIYGGTLTATTVNISCGALID